MVSKFHFCSPTLIFIFCLQSVPIAASTVLPVKGEIGLPPSAPTLVFPADNSFQDTADITFQWNAVSGAIDYWFQLSFDANFSNVPINQTTGNVTSKTLIDFPMDGTVYYWRVSAGDPSGWSNFSPVFSFTSGPNSSSGSVPNAPTLSFPPDESYQDTTEIDFSWNAVSGATDYNFQLAFDASFSSTPINLTTGGALTQPLVNFPNDGTIYYWRVRAGNGNGWGNFSAPFEFINGPDTSSGSGGGGTLATPYLTFPPDNSYQDESDITFTWDAVSGATDYRFQLAFDANFNSLSNDFTTGGDNFADFVGFLQNGTVYYWRVQAGDGNGWGSFSQPFSFLFHLLTLLMILHQPRVWGS